MCWTAQFRHDSDVYLLCLLPLLGLLPGSVSDLSDDTTGISRTILDSTGSVKSFKLFKIVLTESGCAELFGQLSPELDCDMFHGESIMMDVRLFRVGLQIVRCVIEYWQSFYIYSNSNFHCAWETCETWQQLPGWRCRNFASIVWTNWVGRPCICQAWDERNQRFLLMLLGEFELLSCFEAWFLSSLV